jgi:hypothetical protein
MTLIGSAAGAILVAAPRAQDFVIKPYFWILIAVAVFDGLIYLRRATGTAALTMNARLIGFGIGIALMVAVPLLAGSSVRYF